ncbi:formin-like protein 3 [Argopecten irradians]|uniref:formin-like protein 3 n=1 Tax=Argopecten irradians TaxID=31199 RepID=UPI0037130BED
MTDFIATLITEIISTKVAIENVTPNTTQIARQRTITEATRLLLDMSYGLEGVASALMSSFTKSRLVALEIMSLVLTDPKGLSRNLDCFTYLRLKNCEPARFRFLISMLMTIHSQNVTFQVCCMKFFNSLLAASPNMNAMVSLHNELTTAGLDVHTLQQNIDTKTSLEHVELERELAEFSDTFIDVDALMKHRSTLKSTNDDLQKQLYVLQDEVQSIKNTSDRDSVSMTSQLSEDGVHPNVPDPPPPPPCSGFSKTSTTAINFPFLCWKPLQDVRETIFQTMGTEEVLQDEDMDAFRSAFRLDTIKPSIALRKHSESRRRDKKYTFLETYRAQNLLLAQRAVGLSAEALRRALDQYDYETVNADSAELLSRFIPTETEMRDVTSLTCNFNDLAEAEQLMVQLVSVSDLEAKLSCIAFMLFLQLVSVSDLEAKLSCIAFMLFLQLVSVSDLEAKLSCIAFMLFLQLVSVSDLEAKLSCIAFMLFLQLVSVSDLEAKLSCIAFMLFLQLVSVSDLEAKLSCIAFMNQFQQKIDVLSPELHNIHKSGYSLLNCDRIRKVFEIILNLGNYINKFKRGPVQGFQLSCLSSLTEMKSSDKKQTLLDFIVRLIDRKYPDVLHWYTDLELSPVTKGSFSRLTSLVQELDDGIRVLGGHMNQTTPGHADRLVTFYDEAEEQVWQLRRSHQRAQNVYKRVCSMFGENLEKTEPWEVFGHFSHFVQSYKDSLNNLLPEVPLRESTRSERTEYAQPGVETSPDTSTDSTSLQNVAQSHSIYYVNSSKEEEFPAYINDLESERTDDVSYYDLEVAEALRNTCESEADGLLCDCCFKETGECDLTNSPYGCYPAKRNVAVENWIVRNNKLQSEYRPGDEIPPDYGDNTINNDKNTSQRLNNDSYDSAFFGSDANVLKSSGRSSQDNIPMPETSVPRSSTPYTFTRTDDPAPDYSRCPSPAGSTTSKDTYSSELSRILTEFEGNLNQYESETTPNYRRFYTVKSIIYL